MITRLLKIGIPLLLISWVLSGCATKKYLSDEEQLINKYKVSVENKPAEIPLSELKSFFRPKPNRKILGVRWKLSTYYKLQTKKQTKFRKWLFRNFGEEPVLYEEDRADRIATKMEKYLDNLGFFNSKVTYTTNKGRKQVDVIYQVKPAQPYLIKKISYEITDSVLNRLFSRKNKESLIKVGNIYNAYTFDNERDRITNNLRNEGYFYFNRNYIQFIIDSSFLNHELELILKINNSKKQAKGMPGQSVEVPHTRYLIKKVEVIPDWSPVKKQLFDTVIHKVRFWNDTTDYRFYYLLDQKKRIKPKAFNSSIYIWPGKTYSALELQRTYRQLFNFRIIRTASITFDTTNAGKTEDGKFSYMNSRIQMQTTKLNSFQVEVEGTNSSGDLGIRGSVVYANKNIFKMGDVFSLRVNGGFEAQSISNDISGQTPGIFNTFEAGISGNFYFPRFLFIVRLKKFNQRFHPVSNINFGFNYQLRPNYARNVLNLDIGYTWEQNKQVKHILTPINFNYVQVIPTAYFDSILENEPNQRLREQYSDHMIFGLKYSYIFNNQNLKYLEHFNYLRVNVETSGNLLYGINSLMTSPPTDELGNYTFFGVRYAQYFRINADFRHYYYFTNKTSGLVFRLLLGYARPYGNSTEVPFEKGFYAGGANDMRGWQFRTLGPGGFAGFSDTITGNFERIGDIQIQGNVEYRFPIYKWLKGSIFADVGNIWLYKENETFVNGEFAWDKFYKEFAVDAGIGIRLDFSFFIFRLDVATPVVDPKYPEGERTRTYFPTWSELVWNFGIGYPF